MSSIYGKTFANQLAIVGVGCRFPNCDNHSQVWERFQKNPPPSLADLNSPAKSWDTLGARAAASQAMTDAGLITTGSPSEFGFYLGFFGAGDVAELTNKICEDWSLAQPRLTTDLNTSPGLAPLHFACQSLCADEIEAALVGVVGPECMIFFVLRIGQSVNNSDKIYGWVRSGRLISEKNSDLTRSLAENLKESAAILGEIDLLVSNENKNFLTLAKTTSEMRNHAEPMIACSLNSFLGNARWASGMAELLFVLLAMKHGEIPQSQMLQSASPTASPPVGTNFWAQRSGPSSAMIHDDSYGTLLAFLFIQSARTIPRAVAVIEPPEGRTEILVVSAQSKTELQEKIKQCLAELQQGPEAQSLQEICSRAASQEPGPWRFSVIGNRPLAMVDSIKEYFNGEEAREFSASTAAVTKPKIAFVYPGQGGQWPGMGRQLYQNEAVFRQSIDECDRVVKEIVGWSITDTLKRPTTELFSRIDIVQPLLTAFYIAMTALWKSWGVQLDAVVGTSMGEAAASYVAGNLSLEDAFTIICKRTQLMRRLSGKGAMAVIELSVDEATKILQGKEALVSVAVSNSPTSTVISGEPGAINEIVAQLEQKEVYAKHVKVDVASHSPQMDQLKADMEKDLSKVRPKNGSAPLYSTVLRKAISGNQMTVDYWVNNLRNPVYFSQTFKALIDDGFNVFLECSPHSVLMTPMINNIQQAGANAVVLPSTKKERDERTEMLASLGSLFAHGAQIQWEKFYPQRQMGQLIDLNLLLQKLEIQSDEESRNELVQLAQRRVS